VDRVETGVGTGVGNGGWRSGDRGRRALFGCAGVRDGYRNAEAVSALGDDLQRIFAGELSGKQTAQTGDSLGDGIFFDEVAVPYVLAKIFLGDQVAWAFEQQQESRHELRRERHYVVATSQQALIRVDREGPEAIGGCCAGSGNGDLQGVQESYCLFDANLRIDLVTTVKGRCAINFRMSLKTLRVS
jgi:hypothetical protein